MQERKIIMSLKGKIAVVTGGSRGIGAAIAERLAKDGADVVITYAKSPDKAKQVIANLTNLGVKAKAVKADAEKPEEVAQAIDTIGKEFGKIDILVNNAAIGIGDVNSPLEEYHRTLHVNVLSVVRATLAAVNHMKKGSKIINISSVLGERASGPGLAPYNMSKFAVTGLTRSWAHDFASKGIAVNAVMPGPIDTDMNPNDGSARAEGMIQATAMKRYGRPEEIASAVAYLAQDEASYITSATLRVDGGINA
jgi:3-oxoacyl-[acyl-carrier protein] reductase